MGANSRRRREDKLRRAARQRATRALPPPPAFDSEEVYAELERSLRRIVSLLQSKRLDDHRLRYLAMTMLRRLPAGADHVVTDLLATWMSFVSVHLENGGWDDADLHELVRRADEKLVRLLPVALHGEVLHIRGVDELIAILRLLAVLEGTPVHKTGAQRTRPSQSAEHPKLRQVRALLAKAESTSFEEEAEALMAKAQELITRHSLSRLVEDGAGDRSDDIVMRRIWLDAPYVKVKGALVHEVSTANSCRAAIATSQGFCTIVGAAGDLDAVELLVTSLLVQGNQAMLRHGARTDWRGRSRTRSFRQSFLIAFAVRVGERLRDVTDSVAAEEDGRLLPALLSQQSRVQQAFDDLVPHVRDEGTTATDDEGWTAGVVAADLASLSLRREIRPAG